MFLQSYFTFTIRLLVKLWKRSRQRQGLSLAFHTIGVQGFVGSVQPPLSEIPGSAPVKGIHRCRWKLKFLLAKDVCFSLTVYYLKISLLPYTCECVLPRMFFFLPPVSEFVERTSYFQPTPSNFQQALRDFEGKPGKLFYGWDSTCTAPLRRVWHFGGRVFGAKTWLAGHVAFFSCKVPSMGGIVCSVCPTCHHCISCLRFNMRFSVLAEFFLWFCGFGWSFLRFCGF